MGHPAQFRAPPPRAATTAWVAGVGPQWVPTYPMSLYVTGVVLWYPLNQCCSKCPNAAQWFHHIFAGVNPMTPWRSQASFGVPTPVFGSRRRRLQHSNSQGAWALATGSGGSRDRRRGKPKRTRRWVSEKSVAVQVTENEIGGTEEKPCEGTDSQWMVSRDRFSPQVLF